MQKDAGGGMRPEAVSLRSEIIKAVDYRLLEEIKPLLVAHGIKSNILSDAFEEALLELAKRENPESAEEVRSHFLELVLWKIFGNGDNLWIESRTNAGNSVSPEILATAYALWNDALSYAGNHGADASDAAEAIVQATHATADRLARNELDASTNEIRDLRKYIFAIYMSFMSKIAAKQGAGQLNYVDIDKWIANRDLSDRGAFQGALESKILCREMMNLMQPKQGSVAYCRLTLGYSWTETATVLDTTVSAAQKALSSGIRRAFGTCMRELRKVGRQKPADIENHLMKIDEETGKTLLELIRSWQCRTTKEQKNL
ncbi:MAG: hypothetical protein JXA73_03160 [Acidobacteria bacterium]|nr:hypothetical protein [Acidobacteriota bacterium]